MFFQKAWKLVLIISNIFSGFIVIGIWFFNFTKIFSKFQAKIPTPSSSDEEFKQKIPNFVRSVRRTIKALKKKILP